MTATEHLAAAADMAAAARRFISAGNLAAAERAARRADSHLRVAEVSR